MRFRSICLSMLCFASLIGLVAVYGDISLDAVSTGIFPSPSGNTLTLSHNLAIGENRMVLVCVTWEHPSVSQNLPSEILSITVDGVSSERLAYHHITSGYESRTETWRVMEIDLGSDGSRDVVVTFDSAPFSRTNVAVVTLIAPGSIPRSLLRTFNFEIWKLKCLGACPEDLYWVSIRVLQTPSLTLDLLHTVARRRS